MPPISKYMTNCMQIRFNLPYVLQVHKSLFKYSPLNIWKFCLYFSHYQHTNDWSCFFSYFLFLFLWYVRIRKESNGHILRSGIWCSWVVSGCPIYLNRNKMFAHLNDSPLLPSYLTMKMHTVFYSHNIKG